MKSHRHAKTSALLVALVLLLPAWPEAHEIPIDVTVQTFVKPEDGRLRFLVRVPLESMRDYIIPTRGPGFVDLEPAAEVVQDAAVQWIGEYVRFFEDGRDLGALELTEARVSIPGDRAFASYETALAQIEGPALPATTDIVVEQAMLDALFEVPLESIESRISIDPRLAHLGVRTLTVLRLLPPDRGERVFQYTGNPGLVRLDPRWYQAAWRFVVLGFDHILGGIDHLLFLLCLVVPVRRVWTLVPIVTSFTIAHSITLLAAAGGMTPDALWFPPLIETLIAASIVYMAFENILGARMERRWIVAFLFGLVHGFGFSFLLSETLQFAGVHLLTSLLAFNVGVELGQIAVLAVTVPLLVFLFRRIPTFAGVVVLSAILAHTGWHWMVDRGLAVLQYDLVLPPAGESQALVAAMRWTALLLVILGSMWGLRTIFDWWGRRAPGKGTA